MADSARSRTNETSSLVALLVTAGVIAALYFGRDLLIPFALAILLAFILAPLVAWIRAIGIPRVPAVISVVVLAFMVLGGIGVVVGSQVVDLVENLPTYRQNIAAKIRSVREGAPGGGIFDRAAETIRELERELEGKERQSQPATPPAEPQAPEVRVRQAEKSVLEILGDWTLPLLGPLGTAGLVVVFVVFFLLGREDLRNRAIRLIGGGLHATTEAMDEAAQRVSRYLLMQLVINVGTSIPFGIALYFIGVPNALLWAVLAAVLRFIPYLGPLVAATLPALLAAAVDPGWGMLLWTLGVYIVMESITNNVIEPRLYGESTGISEVAIIMSAIFWTALWGPVGLFLSTPLTVCLAVMGRHVPQLAFLDVLLGKEPALSPTEHFYQRLLAGDAVEGAEIAESFIKEKPVVQFYEEVALPALNLAERDRQRGALDAERRATVAETALEIVDDLEDELEQPDDKKEKKKSKAEKQGAEKDEKPAEAKSTPASAGRFLCLAARTGFDLAAAAMLAQLLRERGFAARPLPAEASSPSGISSLDTSEIDAIYVCYVGFANTAHARHLLRRVRRRAGGRPIVVALWPRELQTPSKDSLAETLTPARIARSLEEATALAGELVQAPSQAQPEPEVRAEEDHRLAEVERREPLDTPGEERFDRITRRLAKAFNAPISLLSLIDEHRQFWKSQVGLPPDLAAACETPGALSICSDAAAAEEGVLVIEDVFKDKRFADNAFLRERGIRFYAGAPLRTARGQVIGSLCVIDTVPRKVEEHERQLLESTAKEVVAEIERVTKPPEGPEASAPAQASAK